MKSNKRKKEGALGRDPLSKNLPKGIFSKTTDSEVSLEETVVESQETLFLEDDEKEKVNIRLSIQINDWLDDLIKQGKRTHGRKIPKEIWVQAALELFQSLTIDWKSVDSVDSLKATLKQIQSDLKNL